MKLTNKQISIVIDEIYNQVSLPIIEENNSKIDSVILKKDSYMKDYEKVVELKKQIEKIEENITKLENKYSKKIINDFEFPNWISDVFSPRIFDKYTKFLKKSFVILKKYPSKEEIEKEIILAGNKDIPELISNLVAKLKQ